MVLRGCLLSLGLVAALMGGYAYWFDQQFNERPASLIFGGVAGFITFFCLAFLNNARVAWRDWRRLSASEHDMQLADGALVAACGTIHPLGDPLVAPFSGKSCVLCEYDLSRQKRAGETETSGSDYVGFLMTPSVVHSPLGEVRVLGFPVLDRLEQRRCTGYSAAWNARQYLASHDFEDRTGVKLVTAVSVFSVVWSDDDGSVEKNMRLGKVTVDELFPPETVTGLERLAEWEKSQSLDESQLVSEAEDEDDEELEDSEDEVSEADKASRPPRIPLPKLQEKRIEVGEQVCVIGVYSAERGGLVPPRHKGPANRLLRGTAAQLAARERSSMIRQFVGGILGLTFLHAVILLVINARR